MDNRVLIIVLVVILFAVALTVLFVATQDKENDFVVSSPETISQFDALSPESLLDPLDGSKQTSKNVKPKYAHTFEVSTIGDRTDNYSMDIMVDSNGFIFVSNGNNSVEKYDSEGRLLSVFGNATTSHDRNLRIDPEYRIDPRGIDIDSEGILYVLDSNHNGVHNFDGNGTYLGFWEVFEDPDKRPAKYWSPSELVFDNNKQFLYIVDGVHKNIQILDKQGNMIDRFGSGGPQEGQFNRPGKIAFDDNGHLHVADRGNDRIQIFDENLEFESEQRGFNEPRDIAFDSNGNIYVLENSGRPSYIGLIKKFDSQWNSQYILTTRDFTDIYIPFEEYDVGFEDIVAIDIGPDDSIYVLDRDQGVHVFLP